MIAGKLSQNDNMRFYFECNPYKAIPVYKLAEFGLQYGRIKKELKEDKKHPMNIVKCKDQIINGQRQTAYAYIPDGQRRFL